MRELKIHTCTCTTQLYTRTTQLHVYTVVLNSTELMGQESGPNRGMKEKAQHNHYTSLILLKWSKNRTIHSTLKQLSHFKATHITLKWAGLI